MRLKMPQPLTIFIYFMCAVGLMLGWRIASNNNRTDAIMGARILMFGIKYTAVDGRFWGSVKLFDSSGVSVWIDVSAAEAMRIKEGSK